MSGPDLSARFAAFAAERFPLILGALRGAFQMLLNRTDGDPGRNSAALDALRPKFTASLEQLLGAAAAHGIAETTPGIAAAERLEFARRQLVDDCDGFLEREAIAASLSSEERIEILRGMFLTRAVDNRLKAFFSSAEVKFGNSPFQGKGFRSLGQEAIYASALRLRRGEAYRTVEGEFTGDVVAPVIRDLGAALAMHPAAETVRMVLNAQMGKSGPPMEGKDLHIGDFARGILPACAPLAVSSLTVAGMALAFSRQKSPRVAVSFIGEGGTSLGEWHEAINLCAARRLPAVFCVENNQTALSTPLREQSAARVFAEKAAGYGIPGLTLDGTDPEGIAAAFAWAAGRARRGLGPALLELVAMRICGHAHHDDMLYLGKEPPISWDYPPLEVGGYADRKNFDYWSKRDPLVLYAKRLEADGVVTKEDVERYRTDAQELVEREARAVIDAPWPEPETAGLGVCSGEPPRRRTEPLEPSVRALLISRARLPELETAPEFGPKGATFLEAVMMGIADALRADPRVFLFGEDIGGKYGNAFLLLRPLLSEFGDRILNSPLSEGAVLGAAIGAALAGDRPIAEMQFNDFVATGFNQLVNNAAKIHYRWGRSVPMVVRMPWGGLRHAGPYHSQNTEAWFYRIPGLKIVVPSTPHDARALLADAVADPDPVLFYEHIALYRDPRIRQKLSPEPPAPLPLGKAALRRAGKSLAVISYGAFVHSAMRVAARLSEDGIEAAVLDLRSLAPLDRESVLALARDCGRVLIVEEDTRTGSIGESLAAIIQEEAFEYLDAPVRIVGSLDTPVPYSPPLEEFFLAGEDEIERAARLLVGY